MADIDRLREQLAKQLAGLVADAAVKVDKGSKHMTLDDLRCPAAAAIYVERALEFLLGPSQRTRMHDVQAAQAHQRALTEKPSEDVGAQARQDITTYGSKRTH